MVETAPETEPLRPLSPAAERALAEAEARRQAQKKAERAREIGGRNGPDPVRYGDWEKNGIASDF
ncbi:MAG TPA: DUF1674 domain-containing protein [Methylovirgula sp.]|nr:DUF1674 domain-containing protein [Methylovirgula sp.]